MGKHLSVEEKLNAQNEYSENLKKIEMLKLEYIEKEKENKIKIKELQLRNRKLKTFLENRKKSPYGGLYPLNGICYKMFGKKREDLTPKEATEYTRAMKQRSRNFGCREPKNIHRMKFRENLAAYYNEGHTLKQTAEQFDVSIALVHKAVWENIGRANNNEKE